jgi:hypothetical protein
MGGGLKKRMLENVSVVLQRTNTFFFLPYFHSKKYYSAPFNSLADIRLVLLFLLVFP